LLISGISFLLLALTVRVAKRGLKLEAGVGIVERLPKEVA
jgi:hypothetical protein